jgi:tRNA (adenine57-N1/adenine58-N1)-methyltransferase
VKTIAEGNDVLLYLDKERTYQINVKHGEQFHTHKGFIQLDDLIGKPYGSTIVSSLGISFYALRPLIKDRVMKTDRRTQVLYPKDIGYILYQLGIGNGSTVVEAGTGSGALTMSLANAVEPDGRVYTYEIDERSQHIAAGNIDRSGLRSIVEMKLGDVTLGITERDVDAVVLDMATPWLVIDHAWDALSGSGIFLSFSPTIEQVMKTVYTLESKPFIEVDTVELILRRITVAENKTRPETLMIGHSGYLTTARKVIPNHLITEGLNSLSWI